jgi:ribokinase
MVSSPAAGAARPRVVVVGQVGRDLVLTVDHLPGAGASADVCRRVEVLGGKGANQARACRQLGADAALVGVVGDDDAGRRVTDEARAAGIDVSAVVTRAGARTALLVDVVGPPGERRLLEHVEPPVLLTADDVRAAGPLLRAADAVLLQLQQPAEAVRAALAEVAGHDVLVVADGAPPDEGLRDALLAAGAVLRADDAEAAALVGRPVEGAGDATEAAAELVGRGARVAALAAGADGDVVAWAGGHVRTPLLGEDPVDPTGAGDSTVAALAVALLTGRTPEQAAWWAAVAARRAVGHAGGRPDLDRDAVAAEAARAGRLPYGA